MRETRAVIPGPMAVVRLGSCGIVHEDVNVGQVIVPDTAIMTQQNFFDDTSGAILLSKPAKSDPKLTALVAQEVEANAKGFTKVATGGLVASADSFYAAQGRSMDAFDQDCSKLLATIKAKYPNHHIFEMEAYYMYKLAELSKPTHKIYTSSACIGLFHRIKHDIVEKYKVKALEVITGKALMDAVTKFQFPEGEPENTKHIKELLTKKI